ncbi:hypothetical protein DRQ00_02950 [candidate division KSB1 bacterium]|nr:MAG: hypothetical protein DRQ00_02950 [candidate division KSB1 bacterium]RKY88976.1 MAG: hypothetical protein DRQ11_02185 [candidate division KSB1 bacterium]HDI52121.1 response regulator [Bacteroidota bacterium]
MYPKNTILLIDDDTSLHDLCRAILARMGYKCISAFNGVEGLEKIREHHPDLILLDLMMPDMDGEQVYQELISNAEYQAYKDIPVIMLTAISHDEERENKMLKLGVSAYLNKPFGLNELVNVIKNVFVTHEIRLHNKRLQEEITSAKQYLERLIDNAPVGVLSSDAKGNIVQVNSFFVNLMGVESVDKLWGQNILEGEVIGRKDVCERFRQVLETGTAVKIPTIDIHNRQGRRINVNINCVPLKDENGNISGLLSIWEDVTEAEKRAYELNILRQIGQAMQSVLELDPLLHLILTSITAGCALGFSRAMILLVNEQKKVLEGKMGVGPTSLEEALEIWDKLAKEHSNLEVFLEKYGLKLPNRNDRFDQIVKKVSVPLDQDWDVLIKTIREKRPFKIENAASNSMVSPEFQQAFDMEEFATAPLIAKNRVVGIVVADNKFSNFPLQPDRIKLLSLFASQAGLAIENAETYRKLEDKVAQLNRAYQQLQEAHEKLLRSERLATVGKMAAHIAHEIRNPLTAIGGFARAILREPQDIENVKLGGKIISREVNRLEKILANVLDFTKISQPFKQQHDINAIIEEVIQLNKPVMHERNISCNIQLHSSLPPAWVDEEQIKQALVNILVNSIHSIHHQGKISVSTDLVDEQVLIEISDNGAGMTKETLENMFNPFFTTKSGGTGLGMAVTQRIIEEHGGEIQVESEKGKGTTFRIFIPLTVPPETVPESITKIVNNEPR